MAFHKVIHILKASGFDRVIDTAFSMVPYHLVANMNLKNIMLLAAQHLKGVTDIHVYETDSSHSNFALLSDGEGKRYICKEIYDPTLAGSWDCVCYEYWGQRIAWKLGFAPEPIFFDKELHIIISEYIDGVQSDDISIDGVLDRASFAGFLSGADTDCYTFPVRHIDFQKDFEDHYRMLDKALTLANWVSAGMPIEINRFSETLADVLILVKQLKPVLDRLPLLLSHNDLVAGNLLVDPRGRKYVIDFETIGLSKADFIIGQLAADAEIDWGIEGSGHVPIDVLYERLNSVFFGSVEYKLFLGRVIERHVQNVCYGYRQLAMSSVRNYPQKYIVQKRNVVDFCKQRLYSLREVLKNELKR